MVRGLRLLVPALLVAGVGLAAPACASQVYGNRGGQYRQVDRRAYDEGYRRGLRDGEDDIRRGRDANYARHNEYRDADQGYRRSDGNLDQYRRSFRQGYQTGYSESFNRSGYNNGRNQRGAYPTYPSGQNYPVYPNGSAIPRGGYRSQAADIGYRDGLDEGQKAARKRDRFDPVRTKRYRDGDHSYDSRYGSREQYKREYRAAFEQGYRDGYQGSRY